MRGRRWSTLLVTITNKVDHLARPASLPSQQDGLLNHFGRAPVFTMSFGQEG